MDNCTSYDPEVPHVQQISLLSQQKLHLILLAFRLPHCHCQKQLGSTWDIPEGFSQNRCLRWARLNTCYPPIPFEV